MKSNEARELMTERVQKAHAKWRDFHDMPEAKGDSYVAVNAAVLDPDAEPHEAQGHYVKALYAAAYQGEPVGRCGMTIVVRKIGEPAEPVARGRVLRTQP